MKNAVFSFLTIFLVFNAHTFADITIYFSHSVDTTLANPSAAHGSVALDDKLIERIDQAQYAIDFCFYNIWRWTISDALIIAHQRGVLVRVITEHDHIDNTAVQNLINEGIPVIDDTYGINTGDGFMHNKFAIFDYRDSTSLTDDWIWTGSYNATDYGSESNANNAVEIRHHELSRAYTIEFEEMWGSKNDIPDPDSSRFQLLKTDNTNHSFTVDSVPLQLYFSPSDHSTPRIIDAVASADSTIYFCIFAYTRQDLCDEMKDRWDNGISVKGVFDEGDWLSYYSKSRDMTGDPSSSNPWNPPAPVLCDSVDSPWGYELLHHKYLIVDADGGQNPIVVTGCQNWSNNGEYYNDENTLIIHSAGIANQFLQEFAERYREAGGSYGALAENRDHPHMIHETKLTCSPNPFSTSTTISLQAESANQRNGETVIQIYDVAGRMVREISLFPFTFFLGAKATWDGKDDAGEKTPPGMYFLTCKQCPCVRFYKLIKVL